MISLAKFSFLLYFLIEMIVILLIKNELHKWKNAWRTLLQTKHDLKV
jgi:hypothetical protein